MGTTCKKRLVKRDAGSGAKSNNDSAKWRNVLILGAIIIYTFMLYAGDIHSEFVTWDDPDYITQNPLIRDLSLHGIINIFSTPVIGMYNPIPFLVYAVEYKFWGLNPEPYNLFSIIFHLLATAGVYKFILRISKRYETAAIVALLFAIHPMHSSVITWASQIKTSLSVIFYFAALNAYLSYVENSYKIKYLLYATVAIILSALSKPEAVTFAPMLLLVDYYTGRKMDKRLFAEKIPFFIICLGFGILTLLTHSQEKDSIFEVNRSYSFINNLIISNYAIVFYFQKLFLPLNLCVIYPYPENTAFFPVQYYLAIPVIPLIIYFIYKAKAFRKELIFGILFFTIAISVLLRLVPSGFFGMADRYSYLSYVGLFFIMGQFVVYVLDNKLPYASKIRNYTLGLLALFLVFCSYLTIDRVEVWQNSISLFDDAIAMQPKFAMAYNHRAAAKSLKGDYKGALEDENMVVAIDSTSAEAYSNRAVYRDMLKDYDGAISDCKKAIELNPEAKDAHLNLANIDFRFGHLQDALTHYKDAIEVDTTYGNAYYNKGLLEFSLHDTADALHDWEKAYKCGVEQSKQLIIAYGGTDRID